MCAFCSPEEVLSIQEFAKSKQMEIIPLVQTFGHMEVKLKPYSHSYLQIVHHCADLAFLHDLIVCVEASILVEFKRGAILRRNPEPTQRGGC